MVKGKVEPKVIMLKFLSQLIGRHAPVKGKGLFHAILQEQKISDSQQIFIGSLLVVFKHSKQPVVLGPERVIEDFARLAQLMRARIDQWFVLKVLIPLALHGINAE